MSDLADRALVARIAAHQSWANTSDRSARTAPARRAALDRFERQVDPDGSLPPDERARRAEHAKRAHFLALARKSALARRKSKALLADADAADAELAGSGAA